jgi:DNA polymerase-3 subunit epsilon
MDWNITNWFKPKVAGDAPDFWQRYEAALASSSLSRKTPIAEVPFVVFDTETTGLDHKKDLILSIGAVRVRNWEMDIRDSFDYYIKRSYAGLEESVAIHGIMPGERDGNIREEEAIARFMDYLGDSVLVAHHIGFDVAMINRSLKQFGPFKLKNKMLDTGWLARRVKGSSSPERQGDYGLDALCDAYGIRMSDRHTAAGDAFITGLLLQKLLLQLEKRGVKTLGDLMRKR